MTFRRHFLDVDEDPGCYIHPRCTEVVGEEQDLHGRPCSAWSPFDLDRVQVGPRKKALPRRGRRRGRARSCVLLATYLLMVLLLLRFASRGLALGRRGLIGGHLRLRAGLGLALLLCWHGVRPLHRQRFVAADNSGSHRYPQRVQRKSLGVLAADSWWWRGMGHPRRSSGSRRALESALSRPRGRR